MAYTENIHKTQQMDTSKNKGKNLNGIYRKYT